MPDNGLLQELLMRANTPLVPQSAIQPTQDALTQPRLNQSVPMAMLKGFGAGALGGLRNQTSPANLAGIASLAAGPAARGLAMLGKAAPAAAMAAKAPMAAEAASGAGRTLGTILPEFAPVGGESSLNINRFLDATQKAGQAAAEPVEQTYARILMARGR